MKVEYDKTANAAYIYLTNIEDGGVNFTYPCDPSEVGGMINLDFDNNNRLLGIEVLDADKILPKELLDNAKIIG